MTISRNLSFLAEGASTTGVLAITNGGTGVTTSSGANSVMLRDANQNVSINRLNQSNTNTVAAAGTTVLTAASSYSQTLTGTGGQTFRMPDATTLTTGVAFVFNNNATGTLTLQDSAAGSIGTVTPGGAVELVLLANGTVAGTWDYHGYIPENVTWGTNSLALGSTVITGGTWQGGTIASGYGGTGLTTFTAANNALYSISAGALAAGTLPVLAGGTGVTTSTGTGSVVLSTSPTLTTPALGTPTALVGTNITGTAAGLSIGGNAATATTASNVNNGTLTMNVSGTGLSGSQTFTANQSSAATFTVTSNATNANTASTIVARDASGNFSAGTITASLSGNATTATTASNATTAGGFTPSQTAGTASRIVVADGNGYIFNNYFNSTDNSISGSVSAIMAKQGDNYYRSATAGAVASFISGQTMNINGSSASCTGNSATATTASYATNPQFSADSLSAGDITNRIGTGMYQNSAPTTANGWPVSGSWYHLSTVTHSNTSNYYSMQFAASFFDNSNLYYRSTNGSGTTGWVSILTTSGATFSGNLTMSGNITAYSDESLKTNWRPVQDNFVAKLAKVKSGIYDRTDTEETQAGVSAQDIQKIISEVVFEDKDGKLSLAYGNAAMIAAVELAKVVEELRAEIAELKAK